MQNPVFEQVQPDGYETWGDFNAASPPEPASRARKRVMYVEAGRFWPYGLGETPSALAKQAEIDAVYELAFQHVVAASSRGDLGARWMGQSFLLLVGASVVIVLVLVALVVNGVLLGSGEVVPPAQ